MYAAMDSRYSEAEVLVNAGADLNIQDLVRNPHSKLQVVFRYSFFLFRRRAGLRYSLQLKKQT